MASATTEYGYPDLAAHRTASHLWKPVERSLHALLPPQGRVFELGCGNGAFAARLHQLSFQVVAVDPSTSGIEVARQHFPGIAFHPASTDDELAARFGRFPAVVSLEVIEHCYSPKRFAQAAFDLLEPGGHLVLTTPYHGYLKNLALAATGKMDAHFTALWEGGHIKFFSFDSMRRLLCEAGFTAIRFDTIGRVPWLAKSMLVVAKRAA